MPRIELVMALLAACALTACARGSVGGTVLPTPAQARDAQDWHDAGDLLSARMRSIAEGLSATGYGPSDFAQRGFLASGARATHEVVAPAGRCLTVVALATSGIADLDAAIFEADGQAVSQDAASDARPVLRACARDEARRLYYVLHAFSGNGAYLVASFEGPLSGAGSAELVSADAGPASHADWTSALVRRGFEPEGPPVELSLSPESQVRVALPARVGQCVALVAFAAEGGADVNLWLADESGVDRVRDDAHRAWAGVQLCPDASGVFTARVSVRGEAARVLVGRFAGRASRVGGERAMWLGDLVEPGTVAAEQDAAKAARPTASGTSGHLSAGTVEQRSVRVPSGRCARLEAELDPGLHGVRVRVASREGQVVRAGELRRPGDGVHVCGQGGRRLLVQVEAAQGVGGYTLRAHPVDVTGPQWESVRAPALAALLDLQTVAKARGWAQPHLERIAPEALVCSQDGCALSSPRTVSEGRCLSAALVDARGRAVPLTVRAPGVTDAKALSGFTSRCAHRGEVELRARVPEAPPALFLLGVEHEAN